MIPIWNDNVVQHHLELKDHASFAIGLVVQISGGARVRKTVAKVLRAYRKAGQPQGARDLRRRVLYIAGNLWKDLTPAQT